MKRKEKRDGVKRVAPDPSSPISPPRGNTLNDVMPGGAWVSVNEYTAVTLLPRTRTTCSNALVRVSRLDDVYV